MVEHVRQRHRVSVCGLTAVVVRENGGWHLENASELAVLGGLGGPSEDIALLLAMAPALEAGLAGPGDLKQLSKCLQEIAYSQDVSWVYIPEDLMAAAAVTCAHWDDEEAQEWLVWTLAERLDENLCGYPKVEAGLFCLDALYGNMRAETSHRGGGWLERLDSSFWDHLANHKSPLVRAANAASNPKTAPSQLTSLAASSDEDIGDSDLILDLVASHPRTPGKVLLDIAYPMDNGDTELMVRAAQNLSTPKRVLRRLVSLRLAEGPYSDNYRLDQYNHFWHILVLALLAQNPNTPAGPLARLSRSKYEAVLFHVACNPNTPIKAIEQLATNPEWSVRRAVAHNPTIPEPVLELLVSDSRREVRAAAANHPNISHGLLTEMVLDRSFMVRKAVAGASSLPVTLLESLADDPDGRVRRQIAIRDDAPTEILARLAIDPDPEVRSATAWNKTTPKQAIAILAEDSDYGVLRSVAGNPKAPLEALLKFARHGDMNHRRDVASNPSSPPEAFRQLDNDPAWGVQYDMANNPSTPPSVLEKLSRHEDRRVRASVASNPSTPVWLVEHLSEDGCYAVFSVASEALAQCRSQGG